MTNTRRTNQHYVLFNNSIQIFVGQNKWFTIAGYNWSRSVNIDFDTNLDAKSIARYSSKDGFTLFANKHGENTKTYTNSLEFFIRLRQHLKQYTTSEKKINQILNHFIEKMEYIKELWPNE